MFPVVVLVLSLLLALPTPPYRFVRGEWAVIAVAAIVTLSPALTAWWTARVTISRLDRKPEDPGFAQHALARGMRVATLATGLGFAGLLTTTDYLLLCRSVPVAGATPGGPGLIALLPFMTALTLYWVALYPADRAIREVGVETQLLRSQPVEPVWTCGRFLMFHMRHQVLFILAPMVLILIARDIIDRYSQQLGKALGHAYVGDLLLGGVTIVIALFAPLIIRIVWDTISLPPGPLRDRLRTLASSLRVRCADVLVWRSGGGMVNAAVIGVVPPLRYVLITDSMIEQMDDLRIEAVFGHEAGHVKRHHILYFLLFAFVSGCAVTVAGRRMHGQPELVQQGIMAVTGLVLGLKWFLVFPWISRTFERQADWFGVATVRQLIDDGRVEEPGELDIPREPQPNALIQAARVFGATLREVAYLNHIAPDQWSWRHGSIQGRADVMMRYAQQPADVQRFERRVMWIKFVIWIAAVGLCGWAIVELRLWELLGVKLG